MYSGESVQNEYDKVGNRISKTDAQGVEQCQYNQRNQLISYQGSYGNTVSTGDINIDGFTNGFFEITTLQPGTVIDRYGSNGSGRFFSPDGIPYIERALPPFMESQPYMRYEVVRPMTVKIGDIAPWFGQPGGGKQLLSDISVEVLIDMGIIKIK